MKKKMMSEEDLENLENEHFGYDSRKGERTEPEYYHTRGKKGTVKTWNVYTNKY